MCTTHICESHHIYNPCTHINKQSIYYRFALYITYQKQHMGIYQKNGTKFVSICSSLTFVRLIAKKESSWLSRKHSVKLILFVFQ